MKHMGTTLRSKLNSRQISPWTKKSHSVYNMTSLEKNKSGQSYAEITLHVTPSGNMSRKEKSSEKNFLKHCDSNSCNNIPVWAPSPAARGAARPAGSWPGTVWPSVHSSYHHGLALWKWISETLPHSPWEKTSKSLDGSYWLEIARKVPSLREKIVLKHWEMANKKG